MSHVYIYYSSFYHYDEFWIPDHRFAPKPIKTNSLKLLSQTHSVVGTSVFVVFCIVFFPANRTDNEILNESFSDM